MANWVKDFRKKNPKSSKKIVKRDRHAIHVRESEQRVVAYISSEPIHYKDSHGQWQEIETDLQDMGGGWYGTPSSDIQVNLDGRVRVDGSDYQQSPQVEATARVDANQVIRDFDGGRYILTVKSSGFKQEIILDREPDDLETLLVSDSGPLPKHYKKFNIFALDANSKHHVFESIQKLESWLHKATYPVTIDPDFSLDAKKTIYGYSDNYAMAHSTSLTSESSILYVGQRDAGDAYIIFRMFISFDTSSIPDGATITQVNFKGTFSNVETADGQFVIYIMNHDWTGVQETDYDNVLLSEYDASWLNTFLCYEDVEYTSPNLDTSWIDKEGSTKYSFMSNEDYGESVPTGDEYVVLNTTTSPPVLVVAYEAATELTSQDISAGIPAIEKPTLSVSHSLTAQDVVAGVPTIDSATIYSTFDLIAQDILAGVPDIETIYLEYQGIWTPMEIDAAPAEIDKPTLTQVHNLTAQEIAAGEPLIESVPLSLGGEIGLSASDLDASISIESPMMNFSGEVGLSVSDMDMLVEIGYGILGFDAVGITAADLDASIAVGTPDLAVHIDDLDPVDIDLAVSIGSPGLTLGPLPAGLSLVDNGDGTAAINGTPAENTAGVYLITLTVTDDNGETDKVFALRIMDR